MICLPDVRSGAALWRLPLTERAAEGLTSYLLEAAAEESALETGVPCQDQPAAKLPEKSRRPATALLADLLRQDAGLLLWSAVALGPKWSSRPTFDDLAAVLHGQRWRFLSSLRDSPPPRPLREWIELDAESDSLSIAARLSLRLLADSASRREDQDPADGIIFWSLLENCDRRLEFSLVGPVAEAPPFPDWFVEERRQVFAAEDDGRLCRELDAVRRALRLARRNLSYADDSSGAPQCGSSSFAAAASVARLVKLATVLQRLLPTNAEFERRLEQERLRALQDFAYGASHEINNPLANIVSRGQSLLAEETDSGRRRKLGTIVSQAFRAHEMISDLMHFAHPPGLRRVNCNARVLLDRVVRELAGDAALQSTELSVVCDGSIQFPGDEDQLAAALRAAGQNSLEALGSGGAIQFHALRASLPQADLSVGDMDGQNCPVVARQEGVQFRILDNGPSFPASARQRLFNPFYCGREAGRGLGLGLSKAWRIVSDHHGQIDIRRTPENLTELSIWLPLS